MPWILGQLTDESAERDRRGEPRRKLRFDVPMRTSDAGKARGKDVVRVLDLSCQGMMISSDAELQPGERIAVILPHAGCIEAEVIWKRLTLFGCSFAEPVSAAAVAAVSGRSLRPNLRSVT